MTNLKMLIRSCGPQSDGFFAPNRETVWRLGTVLLARRGDAIAVVRKAAVETGNYEFEGLWSLPGGMVRASDAPADQSVIDLEALIRQSVLGRAEKEATLRNDNCHQLRFSDRVGPIVTSYTAKGVRRFTLVVVQVCEVSSTTELQPNDRSIDTAIWTSLPVDWEHFAPANRIAIAHAVWGELSAADRRKARRHIKIALEQCSVWGRLAASSDVPGPWAKEESLVHWRQDWSARL